MSGGEERAGGATGGLTLLVVAKEPVAGRVKTRLQSVYSPEQAARLAAAALADTLRTVRALPAARRVLVLDGRPGPWLPRGFEVWPQCAGGLDERLAAAFDTCAGSGPALLVGMDTPQLTRSSLAPALCADAWRRADAYYGPAADGGFWALGMARPDGDLVRGVPMSTAHTGAAQRARLTAAGLRVADLPPLRDVDTPADVAEVAPLCAPDASFRREATRLRPPGEAVPRDHATPQPAEAPRPQPAAAGSAGRPPAAIRAGRPS